MKLFTHNLRTLLTSKKHVGREKGQSLAEMVISMTVLVMLMSGVIDIGRVYFAYVALEDAAGEAALYMSTNPYCPYDGVDPITQVKYGNATGSLDTTTTCEPPDNAIYRATNAGGSAGIINWADPGRATFEIKCYKYSDGSEVGCNLAKTGDTVFISIQYRFDLLSPIIPNINGKPTITLTGKASEVIVAAKK